MSGFRAGFQGRTSQDPQIRGAITQDATTATGFGAGFVSDNDSKAPTVSNVNGRIITKLYIDMTGNSSIGDEADVIGDGTDPAYIYKHVNSVNGFVEAIYMTCVETPTTGDDEIDLILSTAANGKLDDDGDGLANAVNILEAATAWAIGITRAATDGAASGVIATKDFNNYYFYLVSGNGNTAGEYDAGKFLITIVGNETF